MLQRVSIMLAVAGLAAAASASINSFNGFKMEYRNFNDYPDSTITPTVNGTSSVRIVEDMGPGQQRFANRHFAMLSADGGATRLSLQNSESFKISYKMRLNSNIDQDGSGQLWPQQPEGGLFFGNDRGGGFIDEGGIFVIGNGTVFIGGANQRFSLIGEANNGTGRLSKGDTLEMSYTYYAPGVTGALAAYVVQYKNLNTGFMTTVFNTFDAGGPDANGFNNGSWVGFRFQHNRNPLVPGGTTNDIEYFDINVVPTSSSLAALALGGLVAARRRRA